MLATNKYAVHPLGEIKQPSGSFSALSSLWGGPEKEFRRIFLVICADMIEKLHDLVSLQNLENEAPDASQLKHVIILEDDTGRQDSLLRTIRQIIKSDKRANSLLHNETVRQILKNTGNGFLTPRYLEARPNLDTFRKQQSKARSQDQQRALVSSARV